MMSIMAPSADAWTRPPLLLWMTLLADMDYASPAPTWPAGSAAPRLVGTACYIARGCCWVMQWIPPPRAKIGRASTVTTSRPG